MTQPPPIPPIPEPSPDPAPDRASDPLHRGAREGTRGAPQGASQSGPQSRGPETASGAGAPKGGSARGRPGTPPRSARGRPPGGRVPVWLQALLIVGFGCGTFLALGLLVVVALALWFLRPGSQVPTAAIAAPDSVGLVRVEPLAEDPGVAGALKRLAREIGAVQEERALQRHPERRRRWGEAQGPPTFLATMWLPRDATLVFERLPGDDELHVVFAANFRWFVRPASAFTRVLAEDDSEFRKVRHAGHTLLRNRHGDEAFAFADSTFLVSDHVELLKLAINRLELADERGEFDEEPILGLPQAREGWDVRGVLHGSTDDLLELLGHLEPSRGATGWPERYVQGELERATVALDWETVDRICGRFTIEVTDELGVDDWLDDIDRELADLADELEPEGLQLSHELELYDGEIRVELELEGMKLFLERIARNM